MERTRERMTRRTSPVMGGAERDRDVLSLQMQMRKQCPVANYPNGSRPSPGPDRHQQVEACSLSPVFRGVVASEVDVSATWSSLKVA